MMPAGASPLQILSAGEALIKTPEGGSAGLWPRTAAVLGRQAIEGALRDFWRRREPGLERCNNHVQLLCLVAYLGNRELAQETSAAWSALSRACHHHPYELSPTAGELRVWLTTARTFAEEVGRQVASGSSPGISRD